MKKVILTIVAVLMMAITPVKAQIFLDDGDWNDGRLRTNSENVGVMVPEQNVVFDEYYTPVGEGIMLLSGLGIAYLLVRCKKDK